MRGGLIRHCLVLAVVLLLSLNLVAAQSCPTPDAIKEEVVDRLTRLNEQHNLGMTPEQISAAADKQVAALLAELSPSDRAEVLEAIPGPSAEDVKKQSSPLVQALAPPPKPTTAQDALAQLGGPGSKAAESHLTNFEGLKEVPSLTPLLSDSRKGEAAHNVLLGMLPYHQAGYSEAQPVYDALVDEGDVNILAENLDNEDFLTRFNAGAILAKKGQAGVELLAKNARDKIKDFDNLPLTNIISGGEGSAKALYDLIHDPYVAYEARQSTHFDLLGTTPETFEQKIPAFVTAMSSPNSKQVNELSTFLSSQGRDPVSLVEAAMESDNPEYRKTAVRTLSNLGEPGLPALTRALQDSSPEVRGAAAKYLVQTGGPEVLPALLSLNDPVASINGIAALSNGDVDALPHLQAALNNPDPAVVYAAVTKLQGMGPIAFDVWKQTQQHTSPTLRKVADRMADYYSGKPVPKQFPLDGRDFFVNNLNEETAVREEHRDIEGALGKVAGTGRDVARADVLGRLVKGDPQTAIEAMDEARSIGAASVFEEALDNPDWQVRAMAVMIAAELGEPGFETVKRATNDQNPNVANMAALSLEDVNSRLVTPNEINQGVFEEGGNVGVSKDLLDKTGKNLRYTDGELADLLEETTPEDDTCTPGSLFCLQTNPESVKRGLKDIVREGPKPTGQDIEIAQQAVGDSFTIEEVLGAGGMGRVYKARDKQGNTVAIKLLLPEAKGSVKALFRGEANAMKSLDHPNIARYIDSDMDGNPPYLVQEYLDGDSLDKLLEQGRVDVRDVARYMSTVLGALEHVHQNGITHRDIKPANIFLTKDGRIKLIDFGISTLEGVQTPSAFSVHYAAPEQITNPNRLTTGKYVVPPETPTLVQRVTSFFREMFVGQPVPKTSQMDVYATGATMYHMLTGRLPIEGATDPIQVKYLKLHEPDMIEPPHDLDPSIPKELSDLVMDMMTLNPNDRLSATEARSRLLGLGFAAPEFTQEEAEIARKEIEIQEDARFVPSYTAIERSQLLPAPATPDVSKDDQYGAVITGTSGFVHAADSLNELGNAILGENIDNPLFARMKDQKRTAFFVELKSPAEDPLEFPDAPLGQTVSFAQEPTGSFEEVQYYIVPNQDAKDHLFQSLDLALQLNLIDSEETGTLTSEQYVQQAKGKILTYTERNAIEAGTLIAANG